MSVPFFATDRERPAQRTPYPRVPEVLMEIERIVHWRASNGVAACNRPAKLGDIVTELAEVTCTACLRPRGRAKVVLVSRRPGFGPAWWARQVRAVVERLGRVGYTDDELQAELERVLGTCLAATRLDEATACAIAAEHQPDQLAEVLDARVRLHRKNLRAAKRA